MGKKHKHKYSKRAEQTPLLICTGKHCNKRGEGDKLLKCAAEHLSAYHAAGGAPYAETDCLDMCDDAPVVMVNPGEIIYTEVGKSRLAKIIAHHLEVQPPTEDEQSVRATPAT